MAKQSQESVTKAAEGTGNREPLSIAKGYNSPFEGKTEGLVDFDSDAYAFLEIEQREFSPADGTKTSKPRIVSYNRNDLFQFLGKSVEKTIDGKRVTTWPVASQKLSQGVSVNVVWHVPESFGMEVAVDEWERQSPGNPA